MDNSIIAGVMLVALVSLVLFNRYCFNRFDYKMFSKQNFMLYMTATVFWFLALAWRAKTGHTGGEDTTGYPLFGVASFIVGWIFYQNLTRTNIVFGLIGSGVQGVLLVTMAYSALFIMILAFAAMVVPLFFVQPVVMLNRSKKAVQ